MKITTYTLKDGTTGSTAEMLLLVERYQQDKLKPTERERLLAIFVQRMEKHREHMVRYKKKIKGKK